MFTKQSSIALTRHKKRIYFVLPSSENAQNVNLCNDFLACYGVLFYFCSVRIQQNRNMYNLLKNIKTMTRNILFALALTVSTAAFAGNSMKVEDDTIVSADGKYAYVPDAQGMPEEVFETDAQGQKKQTGRKFSPQKKQTTKTQDGEDVFDVVEQMPQYPGGHEALFEFLSGNVKYPEDAQKQKIQGTVILSFVVKKDGSITDVNVVRSVFPSLDAEAQRVIKAMPNWVPGKQNGKVVNVHYVVPIKFLLN